MRRFVPFLIVLVIAALVGAFLAYWETRPAANDRKAARPQRVVTEEASPKDPTTARETPESEAPEPMTDPNAVNTEVTAENWEDKLDEILVDEKMDTDEKADKIAEMIPKLPEAAQKELAEHLSMLISDERYEKAADLLKNDKTPGSVSQVLLDDLFNRDQALSLPLFLEVAKNDNHPLKAEALENLELILMDDHGTNWTKWQEAITESIKEQNPGETP